MENPNQWKYSAIGFAIFLTALLGSSGCGSASARLPFDFPNVFACGFINNETGVSVYCETVKRPVKVKELSLQEIIDNRYICFSPEDTGRIVRWAEEQEE